MAAASSLKSLPRALGILGLRTGLLQGKRQTDNTAPERKDCSA